MITSLFALAGAFVYRMRGGMKPSFPRPVDQMLFALPYGVAVFLAQGPILGLAAFVLTTLALVKGHGNSMDLGDQDKTPEWYEFLIKWLKPKISLYWYDATGLALSGLSYTLPAGILMLNPWIALSGVLKSPAYMLAKKAGAGTEGGELLTGALLWAAIGAAFLV